MHTCAHTHTHTHTHTHDHTQSSTHTHKHTRAHTQTNTDTQTHTHNTHMNTHTRVNANHFTPGSTGSPYVRVWCSCNCSRRRKGGARALGWRATPLEANCSSKFFALVAQNVKIGRGGESDSHAPVDPPPDLRNGDSSENLCHEDFRGFAQIFAH